MYLYICENYKVRGTTEELIQRSLDMYIEDTGTDIKGLSRNISRSEKGKPYFEEIPVEFSVSHTDNIWVCLMSQYGPVGVDIQKVRRYNFSKIAERYYTEDEQRLVEESGEEVFFEIWTRKEAYAKYTGKGLGRYLSDVSTVGKEKTDFVDVNVKEGMKCSCCIEKEKDIWIKRI